MLMQLFASFAALTLCSGDATTNDMSPASFLRARFAMPQEERRLESYEELMNIAHKAETHCLGECWRPHTVYWPLNMDGHGRTMAGSPKECQERCANVTGCAHFSFWVDGGCHIQDHNAVATATNASNGGYTELSGPPKCPEMNETEKERLKSRACAGTPAPETQDKRDEDHEDNSMIAVIIVCACALVIFCCIAALRLYLKSKRELTIDDVPAPPQKEPIAVVPMATLLGSNLGQTQAKEAIANEKAEESDESEDSFIMNI